MIEERSEVNEENNTMIRDLQLKRLQRAVEYALLAAFNFFFLLAFQEYYLWWMALLLGAITFGMNFQLTQLREKRRTADVASRPRIVADAFESILFLLFIVTLTLGGLLRNQLSMTDQEYQAYVSALLIGLFLAGLVGELYWQMRFFGELDQEKRRNYIANLKRTIILPYTVSRRRS